VPSVDASDVKPNLNEVSRRTFKPLITSQHLTKYEVEGLELILSFMKSISLSKRQVPKEMLQPDELLDLVEVCRLPSHGIRFILNFLFFGRNS
jgi:hypothetical protein